MKQYFSLLSILTLVLVMAGSIQAQIEDDKASITFLFVSKDVRGSISNLKTDIKIHQSVISNSYMKGSVEVETMQTGNFFRDSHLMWKRYFYKKAFPKIEFVSSSVSEENGKLKVTGILTIKETSKTIEIIFEKKGKLLKGETSINCYDYGVKIDKNRNNNLVKVYFNFPFK